MLPIVLDLDAYRRPPSPVVRRLYDDGRVNVLFVGRIIPNKRIDDLIRSFAVYQRYLRAAQPPAPGRRPPRPRAVLRPPPGDGPRRCAWTRWCSPATWTTTSSWPATPWPTSSSASPSTKGFCVPLLEAMTFGVPVLAYDAGAVAETLRGGGVLLKDKKPEAVAELMNAVRADPALRRSVLATQERALRAGPRHRLRGAADGAAGAGAGRPGGRAPVRVDQWVPALHKGDAIGDSARLMRDAFRSLGHDRRRVRAGAGRRAPGRRPPWSEWRPGGPDDVVILHYALPSPLTAALKEHRGRRVLLHHNITPPEFFSGYDAEMARICALGREELQGLAGHVDLGLADSEFNRRELEAGRVRPHRRAAHLPGLRAATASRRARSSRACSATGARTCSSWAAWPPTSGTRTSSGWPRTGRGSSHPTCGCCWWASSRSGATTSTPCRRLMYEEGFTPAEVVFTGHVDHGDLLAVLRRLARLRLDERARGLRRAAGGGHAHGRARAGLPAPPPCPTRWAAPACSSARSGWTRWRRWRTCSPPTTRCAPPCWRGSGRRLQAFAPGGGGGRAAGATWTSL